MDYQPIASHGVIGNMHTAALVGMDGSIDWLCFPHFDSPSLFGAVLDDAKGGRFRIAPAHEQFSTKQLYWPDTNVLITRFLSPDGVGEVTDFMPIGLTAGELGHHAIVRRVRVARGELTFRVLCRPAFDYARAKHTTELVNAGAVFSSPAVAVQLCTKVPLTRDGSGDGVVGEFVLREGESASFSFSAHHPSLQCAARMEEQIEELFQQTVSYWRRWLARSTYSGRWREMVHRSALLLKLLTFEPTGAIVAAPTTSLPERLGGSRNWDYRYAWLRDAAFTVYGLIRIGFTDEAAGFIRFLAHCLREAEGGSIQIVYGIDGRHELIEEELSHLEGYRGSRPVRIGNAAFRQLQLDVYGELMDAVYLSNKYGMPTSYDTWVSLRRNLDWLCEHWEQPDEGIWEVRGGRRRFVYSQLMCWVAFDRALRLADKRSFPADRQRWLTNRDQIYEEILRDGWNSEVHSFVQSYGSSALDASVLIMPLVFFMSPSDPRMMSTLRAINRAPRHGGLVSDGLVLRYDTSTGVDALAGEEGTFNMCTFWLVEALTRAGRHHPRLVDEARLMFERMLGYANHLGLYSEETGSTGEALGNFPQAFTHLALISAAYNLDRALSGNFGV
jgi:GH15 family glucan-1,4-alpha-glucosidase